jgi:hypothetical protein
MKLFLAISIICAACLGSASAEVRFGPFSWSPNPHSIVIVSPDATRPGVFIGYDSESASAQELSLARFFSGKGLSLFMAFDPKRHAFTEIILGSGKRIPVVGGFTLRLGELRIGVNAITGHTQEAYWSITLESKDKPFIMGYSGLSELIALKGATAISFLEANQVLSEEWSSSLQEYRLSKNNVLQIAERTFAGDVVGVTLRLENPCLKDDTRIQQVDGADSSINDFLVISLSEKILQVYRLADGIFGVVRADKNANGLNCIFAPVKNN